MQDVLHIFKRRLTNLSQRNRSLKLARLSPRRDVDWKSLAFLDDASAEDLLARLLSGKEVKLLSRLDPRFEPANLMDRRLNQVFRTVEALFEETGSYDLAVGYPMVEGKFADGSSVRCPVVLFPVRLVRQLNARPRWKLEPLENEPVTLNPTFFLAYEQFQQSRLKPEFWETELDPQEDWLAWLQQLYQLLKAHEVEVNFNSDLFDRQLETFADYQPIVFEQFKTGTLKFRSQAVLGIFPQSDSALLQDYDDILHHPTHMGLENWLGKKPVSSEADRTAQPEAYIREENRFFVTPVDQSQEDALLHIKQGGSLLIYGPPGTGKSQVIVNIIADALAHGKRVLMVSQKRAALDVVYKRLAALGLDRFSMLVHDHRLDRTALFSKLAHTIDDIPAFKTELADLNLTRWDHEFKRLSREADQLHREFEELHQALNDRSVCGVRIHDLYQQQDNTRTLLPLREIAASLDHERLDRFLSRMAQVIDYREFFEANYPWRHRLSLHLHGPEARQRLTDLLYTLPDTCRTFRASRLALHPALQPISLDLDASEKWLHTVAQVQGLLSVDAIRLDVEALLQMRSKPATVRKNLDKASQILEKMAELTLLKAFPWSLFDTGKEHLATLKAMGNKPGRWLSLPFWRARWFWGKWLQPLNLKLEDAVLAKLRKEFAFLERWHALYLSLYEQPFFVDFPLMESLADQELWLTTKGNHLLAFETIMAFTSDPLGPKFPDQVLDRANWIATTEAAQALHLFRKAWVGVKQNWQLQLHASQIARLEMAIEQPEADAFPQALIDSFAKDFFELQALDGLLAQFPALELQALEALMPRLESYAWALDLLDDIRQSIWYFWIEKIEARFPVLQQVTTRGWPRKSEEYAEKIQKRQAMAAELVRHRIREQVVAQLQYNRLGNPVTYRELYHQTTKKRKIWPVRKLVQQFWGEGLERLAPCWMASPESVAAIFPMQENFFDVVIFDEASQCFVERAIPVSLRGRQTIIAGDDKQLQPLDLYRLKYDDSDLTDNAAAPEALETESILDLARIHLPEHRLSWHYRSESEALIQFSNQHFYEGKLAMIPPVAVPVENQPPIAWVAVPGIWENNRNRIEAEAVVDLLLDLLKRPDRPSIGIVTFNFFQQELIRDLIDAKLEALANEDPEVFERLSAAMNQVEDGEFVGLFVKNIENVQGDERDIIVFSIGYGPDTKGKVSVQFGLLNQAGGENRLNVAVTRARKKVYVVASLTPDQLSVEGALHPGPRLFKAYLTYARMVSSSWKPTAVASEAGAGDLSAMGAWLMDKLRADGWVVYPDLGSTSYRLGLAVARGAAPDVPFMGIELEGAHYFRGLTPKDREVYRPGMLRRKGWRVFRVWGRAFWQDRERMWEALRAALGEGVE